MSRHGARVQTARRRRPRTGRHAPDRDERRPENSEWERSAAGRREGLRLVHAGHRLRPDRLVEQRRDRQDLLASPRQGRRSQRRGRRFARGGAGCRCRRGIVLRRSGRRGRLPGRGCGGGRRGGGRGRVLGDLQRSQRRGRRPFDRCRGLLGRRRRRLLDRVVVVSSTGASVVAGDSTDVVVVSSAVVVVSSPVVDVDSSTVVVVSSTVVVGLLDRCERGRRRLGRGRRLFDRGRRGLVDGSVSTDATAAFVTTTAMVSSPPKNVARSLGECDGPNLAEARATKSGVGVSSMEYVPPIGTSSDVADVAELACPRRRPCCDTSRRLPSCSRCK